jgi:hypothetical protein
MLKKFLAGFAILMAIGVIWAMNAIQSNPLPEAAKPSPAEVEKSAKDDANLHRAVRGAQSLRAAMRNPDSFKLASVHVKTTGAVCYSYRAQNGFGGMNLEYAALAPGSTGLKQNASAWNSQCAHVPGDDQTDYVSDMLVRLGDK